MAACASAVQSACASPCASSSLTKRSHVSVRRTPWVAKRGGCGDLGQGTGAPRAHCSGPGQPGASGRAAGAMSGRPGCCEPGPIERAGTQATRARGLAPARASRAARESSASSVVARGAASAGSYTRSAPRIRSGARSSASRKACGAHQSRRATRHGAAVGGSLPALSRRLSSVAGTTSVRVQRRTRRHCANARPHRPVPEIGGWMDV